MLCFQLVLREIYILQKKGEIYIIHRADPLRSLKPLTKNAEQTSLQHYVGCSVSVTFCYRSLAFKASARP
eukprot:c28504_g1_i9 orf=694-903(-)